MELNGRMGYIIIIWYLFSEIIPAPSRSKQIIGILLSIVVLIMIFWRDVYFAIFFFAAISDPELSIIPYLLMILAFFAWNISGIFLIRFLLKRFVSQRAWRIVRKCIFAILLLLLLYNLMTYLGPMLLNRFL